MTPNEILNKRFSKSAVGGYRVEEVHTYLAEISDYIRQLSRQQEDLERKLLFLAEKVEEYREDEESLRAALINAQKTGEKVVEQAREEAFAVEQVAQERADSIVKDAKKQADTLVSTAKLKADTEEYTLNRMQREVSRFRSHILHLYEKQIELINALPHDLSDVDPMENPLLSAEDIEYTVSPSNQIAENTEEESLFVFDATEDALSRDIPPEDTSGENSFGMPENGMATEKLGALDELPSDSSTDNETEEPEGFHLNNE